MKTRSQTRKQQQTQAQERTFAFVKKETELCSILRTSIEQYFMPCEHKKWFDKKIIAGLKWEANIDSYEYNYALKDMNKRMKESFESTNEYYNLSCVFGEDGVSWCNHASDLKWLANKWVEMGYDVYYVAIEYSQNYNVTFTQLTRKCARMIDDTMFSMEQSRFLCHQPFRFYVSRTRIITQFYQPNQNHCNMCRQDYTGTHECSAYIEDCRGCGCALVCTDGYYQSRCSRCDGADDMTAGPFNARLYEVIQYCCDKNEMSECK